MKRGAIILLEGCDRAGKTTQTLSLLHHLQDTYHIPCKLYRFPDRNSTIGQQINSYLQNKSDLNDCAIHLLFSANRWELYDSIKKDIENGITIIMDRYVLSGVAFSAAKGLDLDWCLSPDIGLPLPDIIFYLYLSVDDAKKRGGFGEERYEKEEFQRKVNSKFMEIKNKLPKLNWKTIEANQTIDEITRQLVEESKNVIRSVESEPLQYF
ncbi:hypothetical protein WA158_006524 [Blastocystis sp. Blastoise]